MSYASVKITRTGGGVLLRQAVPPESTCAFRIRTAGAPACIDGPGFAETIVIAQDSSVDFDFTAGSSLSVAGTPPSLPELSADAKTTLISALRWLNMLIKSPAVTWNEGQQIQARQCLSDAQQALLEL